MRQQRAGTPPCILEDPCWVPSVAVPKQEKGAPGGTGGGNGHLVGQAGVREGRAGALAGGDAGEQLGDPGLQRVQRLPAHHRQAHALGAVLLPAPPAASSGVSVSAIWTWLKPSLLSPTGTIVHTGLLRPKEKQAKDAGVSHGVGALQVPIEQCPCACGPEQRVVPQHSQG